MPKQNPIRSMQPVLVDFQYKKAYIFNNLIKCNFFDFTLLMPPYLQCPGPSPPSPPSGRPWVVYTWLRRSAASLALSPPSRGLISDDRYKKKIPYFTAAHFFNHKLSLLQNSIGLMNRILKKASLHDLYKEKNTSTSNAFQANCVALTIQKDKKIFWKAVHPKVLKEINFLLILVWTNPLSW